MAFSFFGKQKQTPSRNTDEGNNRFVKVKDNKVTTRVRADDNGDLEVEGSHLSEQEAADILDAMEQNS